MPISEQFLAQAERKEENLQQFAREISEATNLTHGEKVIQILFAHYAFQSEITELVAALGPDEATVELRSITYGGFTALNNVVATIQANGLLPALMDGSKVEPVALDQGSEA